MTTSSSHTQLDCEVGRLTLIASPTALLAVLWELERQGRVRIELGARDENHPILLQAVDQLREYFAGERRSFALPLDPQGTPFQRQVWQALERIPYGETRSYGQLAAELGSAGASRAVGAANGRNPISIILPCHRVLGSGGQLTGFAGGLEVKRRLLALEARHAGQLSGQLTLPGF